MVRSVNRDVHKRRSPSIWVATFIHLGFFRNERLLIPNILYSSINSYHLNFFFSFEAKIT